MSKSTITQAMIDAYDRQQISPGAAPSPSSRKSWLRAWLKQ